MSEGQTNLINPKEENNKDNSEIKDINIINDENIEFNNPKENLEIEIDTQKKKRYFGIDLIRVFSCFLVILFHSGCIYYIDEKGGLIKNKKNIWPGIYNSLARVCVPLFVIISGYLLLPVKTDYKTFFKKRITRIIFPFFSFCIFYDIYHFAKGEFDWKQFLLNIPQIFLNYGTYLGHLWYIYMILGLYLFMPIISPWIERAEKVHFYYYFIIWIISSTTEYIHLFYGEVWGEAFWNKTSTVSGFIGEFGYAVFGAFSKLHLKDKNYYLLGIILYIIGSGVTMFGFFYKRNDAKTTQEIEITWQFDSTNVLIASCGLFLLLRKIDCKNSMINKIFNDIALKSFGMYLIHMFFRYLFEYAFDARNKFPAWSIFSLASITFISSYIVIKILSYIPYSQYIIG